MNKIFKDKDIKRSIYIYTISGILISTFIILLLNIDAVKAFISNFISVLSPFIWGAFFALMGNKPASFIEKKLPKKWDLSKRRFIGALCTTLLIMIIIVLVIVPAIPQIVESVSSLSSLISEFAINPSSWINNIQNSLHLSNETVNSIYSYSNEVIQSIWKMAKQLLPNILSATVSTVSGILNFIIGFIICLYILTDKQRIAVSIKKVSMVLLNTKTYKKGRSVMYLALEKFTNFFTGKIVDSIIVGIICFIAMLFIDSDYAVIISVIVGVTNIIPFFGPFIGGIPCGLILLIVNPIECLEFIIMIIVLQQIDGNIIGPKILGESVGLSSLLIMFAIVVAGAYFGFLGMILGVPIFSVIYYVLKDIVDEKFKKIS